MMKKIIFGLILLMISSVVFAGDYNSTTGAMSVSLKKGWNLVPTYYYSNTDIGNCLNSIEAMYFYSGYQKSYVGVQVVANQPNPGLNAIAYSPSQSAYELLAQDEYKYPNSMNNPYYGVLSLGSMWMYSTSTCTMQINLGKKQDSQSIDQAFLDKYKLKEGWNFVNVHSWMLGKELKDILKNCSVSNANVWNSESQNWTFSSSTQGVAWATQSWGYSINESGVGTTFVVKVANDCSLNLGQTITGPPALPQ
jgi:hypothetical protein